MQAARGCACALARHERAVRGGVPVAHAKFRRLTDGARFAYEKSGRSGVDHVHAPRFARCAGRSTVAGPPRGKGHSMADPAVGLILDETMAGGFALGATDPDGGAKVGKPPSGTKRSATPRPPLASPADDLLDGATATVVVIGSGYGGGIAASRLARAGQKVVVLERGKEWRAGDFPTGPHEAAAQLQVDSPAGRFGARTGLYDLRNNAQVDVVVGCGLGGTSLINASVSLEPAAAVFDDPRWP